MLALLLACWSPDPQAAPVQLPDLDPMLTGPVDTDTEPPAADTDTPPEDEAPPPAPAFDPYDATTTSAPVTLVDDFGKPVTVLQQPGTPVRVIGEEPIRKRVQCTACVPVTEGWVQPTVVTDRK